jgi:hypothetical protein
MWILIALVVIAAGAAVYYLQPALRAAGFATEYVAKRACLCVYVNERELAHCMVEMPEIMGGVEAELVEGERAVRARISFFSERTARYREGSGCRID